MELELEGGDGDGCVDAVKGDGVGGAGAADYYCFEGWDWDWVGD